MQLAYLGRALSLAIELGHISVFSSSLIWTLKNYSWPISVKSFIAPVYASHPPESMFVETA